MKIGIYHGYELTGSGTNEYTRYLARFLAEAGHTVHIICREPFSEQFAFIAEAFGWHSTGHSSSLFKNNPPYGCVLHRLPDGPVSPVFLTDKQHHTECDRTP